MVKNLKDLRNKYGISQQQLADVIGVTQQSINKYENQGVEPDISTLIKLADYFSTSVDYLIGRAASDTISTVITEDELEFITDFKSLKRPEKEAITLIVRKLINQ